MGEGRMRQQPFIGAYRVDGRDIGLRDSDKAVPARLSHVWRTLGAAQRGDMQGRVRRKAGALRGGRGGYGTRKQGVFIVASPILDLAADDGNIDGRAADRVQGDTGAGLAATFQKTGLGQSTQRAVD